MLDQSTPRDTQQDLPPPPLSDLHCPPPASQVNQETVPSMSGDSSKGNKNEICEYCDKQFSVRILCNSIHLYAEKRGPLIT